jgi:hypothetical protein
MTAAQVDAATQQAVNDGKPGAANAGTGADSLAGKDARPVEKDSG